MVCRVHPEGQTNAGHLTPAGHNWEGWEEKKRERGREREGERDRQRATEKLKVQ